MNHRNTRRLSTFAVLAVLVTSCGGVADIRAETPLARVTEPARAIVPVRRAPIADTVRAVGRIASASETPLFFRAAGRVRSVKVEAQQAVQKDTLVAELETGQLGVQLEIARTNVQIAELNVAQQARAQQFAETTASANLSRAKADVARAVAEMENRRVLAESNPAPVNGAAQAAALNAIVGGARSRLDAVMAGADASELAGAEQGAAVARAALKRAEADLEKVRTGNTPEDIRAQEHALDAAKNALLAVQVERDAARGRGDGAGTASAEARISAAQSQVDAQRDRLSVMKAGGKPADIAVAENAVEAARSTVSAAETRLQLLKAGPKPAEVATARGTVAEAEARVAASQIDMATKESALKAAQAGASSSIAAASAAVDAAVANVQIAQAAYDQQTADTKDGGPRSQNAVANKQLQIARLNVAALEQQLEDARIRAPSNGVIQMSVKAGDQVQAYGTIGIFADPSKLEVSVDLPASDLAKVALGQEATVTIGDAAGVVSTEKVTGVPTLGTPAAPVAAGDAKPVRLSLGTTLQGIALGTAAKVTIITQKKDSALLVPASAVKRVGGRRLVQVVGADGRRRDVEVETGIVTDSDVEIIDGVTEGQAVVS